MDHTRAQIAFIAIQGTLLIEDRRRNIIYDVVVSNCLLIYGCLIPMLVSWFLKKSAQHSTKLSQQSLYQKRNKYDKNNSKAIFCLLEPLVYIQLVTCTRLSRIGQFTGFHYLPISSKIFANMLHLSFLIKLTFSTRKCH